VKTSNIHVDREADFWVPSSSPLEEREYVSLEPPSTFLDEREVVF
jgi:hypothetical protein